MMLGSSIGTSNTCVPLLLLTFSAKLTRRDIKDLWKPTERDWRNVYPKRNHTKRTPHSKYPDMDEAREDM